MRTTPLIAALFLLSPQLLGCDGDRAQRNAPERLQHVMPLAESLLPAPTQLPTLEDEPKVVDADTSKTTEPPSEIETPIRRVGAKSIDMKGVLRPLPKAERSGEPTRDIYGPLEPVRPAPRKPVLPAPVASGSVDLTQVDSIMDRPAPLIPPPPPVDSDRFAGRDVALGIGASGLAFAAIAVNFGMDDPSAGMLVASGLGFAVGAGGIAAAGILHLLADDAQPADDAKGLQIGVSPLGFGLSGHF